MQADKKERIRAYKEQKTVGGVCLYLNTKNERYLIVGTPNIKGAQNAFNFAKQTGTAPVMCLGKEWAEHGGDAFTFTVLDECEQKPEVSQKEFREEMKALAELYKQDYPKALSID